MKLSHSNGLKSKVVAHDKGLQVAGEVGAAVSPVVNEV